MSRTDRNCLHSGLSDEARFDFFPEPIIVSLDIDGGGVVQDPVQDGCGFDRIPKISFHWERYGDSNPDLAEENLLRQFLQTSPPYKAGVTDFAKTRLLWINGA
jgi:hypothetical protein